MHTVSYITSHLQDFASSQYTAQQEDRTWLTLVLPTSFLMGFDAYMHNNFIEILCATGLIGFILYYGMYVYILKNLIKYKNGNKRSYIFGLMWLVISLIMDVGMVSYYGKTQCFYMLVQFLNVYYMKKNIYLKYGCEG